MSDRGDSKQLKERRENIRSTGSAENRTYIRTETSVPVKLQIEAEGSIQLIKGVTCNVSATGMMIELDQKIALDTKLGIDILPSGASNAIHCDGKVVWVSQSEKIDHHYCGIEFADVEEDNKNTFLKFLCDAIYNTS